MRSPVKTAGSGRTSRSITGGAAAHERRAPGPVQAGRDGRADRTRSDDRNAYAHLRQATALPFIQKHSRAMHSESPAPKRLPAVPAGSVRRSHERPVARM